MTRVLDLILVILTLLFAVSVVDVAKSSVSKKARNCYFATPKLSSLEKLPRLPSARTKSSCSDKLIELSSLSANTVGHFFGAPSEEHLILSRYEGVFLNDTADLSQWKDEMICDKHLKELSRQFYGRNYQHQIKKNGIVYCGFPEKDHENKAVQGLELTYSQSDYLLQNRHFLLLPGTPLCRRHHDEMIGIAADKAHPSPLHFEEGTGTDGADGGKMEVDSDGEESDCAMDEDDSDEDFNVGTSPNTARSHFLKWVKAVGGSRMSCKDPWEKVGPRDKNYRMSSMEMLIHWMVGVVAKTEEGREDVIRRVIGRLGGKVPNEEVVSHEIITVVADMFFKAANRHEKLWTIAPLTQIFHYALVASYIDGLTSNMWTEATKMALSQSPIPHERHVVLERYDPVKLEFFISFISSPHILVGLPWGHSRVKDSTGKWHDLPASIRQMGIYETIDMYIAYMKENGLEDLLLKRTTMYKILSYLPIKQAHSLTCVDYFAADLTNGLLATDRMIDELVTMTFLKTAEAIQLKREYTQVKLYFKGNYRLHVKMESHYADHCLQWALSDPNNAHFASPHVSHQAHQRCPDCMGTDTVLMDTEKLLKEFSGKKGLTFDQQKKIDGYIHDFGLFKENVYDLKAHYARAVFASMERQRIIESVGDNQAAIVLDFAQKWEAEMYREPQHEYFGKAGSSWHGIHIYANVSGKSVVHNMIHLMRRIDQDTTAVVAIVKHALSQLDIMGIKGVHIRMDNAPYYHSSALIASMPQITIDSKVEILTLSYSEAQAGKGPVDQSFSQCKRKMRSFRDKQHDVVTPDQMFEALTAPKQLRGYSFYLVKEMEETKKSKTKIPKITELSHFEYKGNEARAWRFHGIGKGIVIKNLDYTNGTLIVEKSGGKVATPALNLEDRKRILAAAANPLGDYEEPTFWLLHRETSPMYSQEPNDKDDEIVTPNRPHSINPAGVPKKSVFFCADCGASFIRWSNFQKHILNGIHKIRPVGIKLLDKALGMFERGLELLLAPIPITPISRAIKAAFASTSAADPALNMGWAIRSGRKGGHYPIVTKAFIKKLFDEYGARGEHLKADEAERLMRADPQILPEEWMTRKQLKSHINTLVKERPKIRAWRRSTEEAANEEVDDDHVDEVEVRPSDEDVFITDVDWHKHLKPLLKTFFSHVDNPPVPNTPIPRPAVEYD